MVGSRVFGLGAVALGVVGLVWGDFATVWQPVQPGVPFRKALAYITAICLLMAGAALFRRATERAGAAVLGIFYLMFGLLWLPRVIGYPQIFATWGGMLEEFCLVAGAVIIYARVTGNFRMAEGGRLLLGLCVLSFAFDHFFALKETTAMVPRWMPPGAHFWAVATGIAHLLAGLAILSNISALWAARLETAMIVGFGLLLWLPALFQKPGDHTTWAANGINLALAGAVWVGADWISERSRRKHGEQMLAEADGSIAVGRDH